MKARPKKPSARGTARKSAAAGKRAAVARKAKVTAKPAKAAKPANAGKPSLAALSPDCTIEHAPQLQTQLGKVLSDRACVTLDFSAVKRCDTAGLQVLAAFVLERREAGRDVAFTGMPESFLATVKLLGLAALFAPAAEVSA
jgi:anti-anti-sigma regulatory factor